MGKIVVFSTNGGAKSIESTATTLKELQNEFTKAGISYSGMKVVDNFKNTLENPDANLREGLTNIFLYPVRTKSGAELSFSECRNFIQEAIAIDEEKAKAHFNDTKNYTNKSTAILRELIASYKPGSKTSPTKAPSTSKAVGKAVKEEPKASVSKAKAVAGVVSSLSESKSKSAPAVAKTEVLPTAKESSVSLKKVEVSSVSTHENIVALIEKLDGPQHDKDEAIKAVFRIQPAKTGELSESELRKQYEEFGRGFNDIKK